MSLLGLAPVQASNPSRRHRAYPLSIFGSVLAWVFTFLVPLAFVAYLPATVLLDRTAELQVTPLLAYVAPLAGVIWLAVAVGVFNSQVGSYQSAGH